jgi:hypothetical protein
MLELSIVIDAPPSLPMAFWVERIIHRFSPGEISVYRADPQELFDTCRSNQCFLGLVEATREECDLIVGDMYGRYSGSGVEIPATGRGSKGTGLA